MFKSKQKGVSPIGVLFVICTFALMVMLALKLTTHYIDYNSIRSAFRDQAAMPGVREYTPSKIWEDIDQQLRINSIRDFNFADSAFISNEDGAMVIGFEYEKREHIFANIDVVLTFKEEFEIP